MCLESRPKQCNLCNLQGQPLWCVRSLFFQTNAKLRRNSAEVFRGQFQVPTPEIPRCNHSQPFHTHPADPPRPRLWLSHSFTPVTSRAPCGTTLVLARWIDFFHIICKVQTHLQGPSTKAYTSKHEGVVKILNSIIVQLLEAATSCHIKSRTSAVKNRCTVHLNAVYTIHQYISKNMS